MAFGVALIRFPSTGIVFGPKNDLFKQSITQFRFSNPLSIRFRSPAHALHKMSTLPAIVAAATIASFICEAQVNAGHLGRS